jgi:Lon protease-like protein
MPVRLPIFPLSVVLFPTTPLPLHIFEPRYRRMLADCLAGDRSFGISPVGTDGELPEIGAVGCVAEVRVNQELPDGRSNIVVVGGPRFALTKVLDEPLPYHVAMVQTFEDQPGSEPAEDRTARLRELFQTYLALLRQLNDLQSEEVQLPDDPAGLSFHAAAAAECDASIKRRLLAERSIARRVEALLLLLPLLTRSLERGLEVHQRSHTNGRGTAHPDLLAGT